MSVTISPGNMKLGKIPNISLTPCKSCPKDAPCRKECYAMKAYRLYPSAKKAWDGNLVQLSKSSRSYFSEISCWLKKHSPDFFRWHVAGDVPDFSYLINMTFIAKGFPDTKFMAFTKRHDLLHALSIQERDVIPKNLTLIASMWPNWGDPKKVKKFRKAWMDDGTETRIPKNAIKCPGHCDDCGMCWSLNELKRDVVFAKH